METKRCINCGEAKSLDQFYAGRNQCKSCSVRIAVDGHRRRKAQRRKEWIEPLLERGCAVCGESDHSCLQLHHADPSNKVEAISTMVSYGRSKEVFEAEVKKDLVVLCANCHFKFHAGHINLPQE